MRWSPLWWASACTITESAGEKNGREERDAGKLTKDRSRDGTDSHIRTRDGRLDKDECSANPPPINTVPRRTSDPDTRRIATFPRGENLLVWYVLAQYLWVVDWPNTHPCPISRPESVYVSRSRLGFYPLSACRQLAHPSRTFRRRIRSCLRTSPFILVVAGTPWSMKTLFLPFKTCTTPRFYSFVGSFVL